MGVDFADLIDLEVLEEVARCIEEGEGIEAAAAAEEDGGVGVRRSGVVAIDPWGGEWEVAFGLDFFPLGGGCGEAEDGVWVPEGLAELSFDFLIEGDGFREEVGDAPAGFEVFAGDGVDESGGDA